MKKLNLILSAAFMTSMMMSGFGSSAQTSVNDTNLQEENIQAQYPDAAETPTVADKPLRFVMMIGMTNLPEDTVNPMCYSNVITLQGPPGWGEKGWLPTGSAEEARQAVMNYKEEFCKACEESSGRKITSSGNFTWVWNQYEDGEEKISKAQAKHPEDVSVKIQ